MTLIPSLALTRFVELQLKKAVELEDPVRVINRTIRLRNIFLDRHAAMFEVPLFPKLRSPETFAGSKLLRLASKTRELSEGTPRHQPQPPNPNPNPHQVRH